MKVYVVVSGFDVSDKSVDGVFSTKEKAEEYIKKDIDRYKARGFNTMGYDIEELEVDADSEEK